MWSSLKDNRIVRKTLLFSGVVLCSAGLLLAGGCASLGTYNPATGQTEYIFISTAEEVALGEDIHAGILKEYELSEDPAKLARLRRIGNRIANISDRQDYEHHFYLIESDELNAFTIPGGNVYFFTGLFDKLETDDRIAGVVAHEIGHGAAKHVIKKYQASLGYSLIASIVLGQLDGGSSRQVVTLGTDTIMSVVFSAYSRQDEFEADRLGVKYAYLAGYDPGAMVETLQILKEESEGGGPPMILRSHPHLDDRIVLVKEEVQRVRNLYR